MAGQSFRNADGTVNVAYFQEVLEEILSLAGLLLKQVHGPDREATLARVQDGLSGLPWAHVFPQESAQAQDFITEAVLLLVAEAYDPSLEKTMASLAEGQGHIKAAALSLADQVLRDRGATEASYLATERPRT